jgi:hypothetical protein
MIRRYPPMSSASPARMREISWMSAVVTGGRVYTR